MFLTRQDGHIAEVDSEETIERLKADGWKESSEEEVEAYRKRKEMARIEAETPEPGPKGVFYQTVSSGTDGYGMSRDILKRHLFDLGIQLQEEFADQKIGLLYNSPNAIPQMKTDVRLIYTMFESDKIPEAWKPLLEQMDQVIVPSKWCADVFKKSGIDATVVPLGYDDQVFKYVDRDLPVEKDEPFTFIHYNSFNVRKGFFEVLEAFRAEFKKDMSVKLILKTTSERPAIPVIPSEYPNVEVIKGEVHEKELAEILGRADCMVYPSRGEGFGITPLEAMATGLPAIVPNAHGISEYFNPNYMMEVKVARKEPALNKRYQGDNIGDMVICDIDDLRRQMRHAVNHQAEMKELGKQASEYVKRFPYRQTAERLATIINEWKLKDVQKRKKDQRYLEVELA